MPHRLILAALFLLAAPASGFAQAQNGQARQGAERRLCAEGMRYAVFAQRPLQGEEAEWHGAPEQGTVRDALNLQRAHEHLFFCDRGKVVRNLGFDPRGRFSEDLLSEQYEPVGVRYNSDVVDGILNNAEFRRTDGEYDLLTNNCQTFARRVRQEYWLRAYEGEWEGTIEGKYAPPPNQQRFNLRVSLRYLGGSMFSGSAEFREVGGSIYTLSELRGELDDDLLVIRESAARSTDAKWCRDFLYARLADAGPEVGNVLDGVSTDRCGGHRHFTLTRKRK